VSAATPHESRWFVQPNTVMQHSNEKHLSTTLAFKPFQFPLKDLTILTTADRLPATYKQLISFYISLWSDANLVASIQTPISEGIPIISQDKWFRGKGS